MSFIIQAEYYLPVLFSEEGNCLQGLLLGIIVHGSVWRLMFFMTPVFGPLDLDLRLVQEGLDLGFWV